MLNQEVTSRLGAHLNDIHIFTCGFPGEWRWYLPQPYSAIKRFVSFISFCVPSFHKTLNPGELSTSIQYLLCPLSPNPKTLNQHPQVQAMKTTYEQSSPQDTRCSPSDEIATPRTDPLCPGNWRTVLLHNNPPNCFNDTWDQHRA